VNREIVVVDDPAEAAAERIATAVRRGGQIALAGGSTPRRAYELVADMRLNWNAVDLWLGDERCVPEDDAHSNYKLVYDTLVAGVADDDYPGSVRRPPGELGPERAAEAFEEELHAAFGYEVELPRFDLLLLGLGPDAHTASLFPNDAALGEREHWAVGVETPGMAPLVPRVTLTLPVLNAAREVLFLISGPDKAEAVARAFADAPDPDAPASLVNPEPGKLTVLLDAAAAVRLGGAVS
jgi:6-phosphogluconolactonase